MTGFALFRFSEGTLCDCSLCTKHILILSSGVGLWWNQGLPGFPVVPTLTLATSGLRYVLSVLGDVV